MTNAEIKDQEEEWQHRAWKVRNELDEWDNTSENAWNRLCIAVADGFDCRGGPVRTDGLPPSRYYFQFGPMMDDSQYTGYGNTLEEAMNEAYILFYGRMMR